MNGKPEFATNQDGDTVAKALSELLGHVEETWAIDYEVAISTAYFNPGGFNLLANRLEAAPVVRLLLGAEPDPGTLQVRHLDPDTPPQRAERARFRSALAGHIRDIERDRDLLGFDLEADSAAKRLIDWLRSGRVEVRRYEDGFLHGKAFIVATSSHGVLVGSSNFTYAGLAKNLELNLGQYQPQVVDRVVSWFDDLWQDAVPFNLVGVYDARYEAHSPYLVYLKMLFERYGREVEIEAEASGTGIHLMPFQEDGVWRSRRILDEYNGTVIADGVGLGKSFVAGELIRQAVQARRQRVLLVAPAALRDGMWAKFLLKHQLGVEVVSYEELSNDQRLNPKATGTTLNFGLNDYAMVVIDEAHAYRNPDTERAAVLRRLLQGSPPKELVLLSATPVNNSLWDLYYLLSYFIKNDAEFADVGVASLRDHFAEAMAEDPDDLSPDRLFDVLDAVAVRRTRHFVKRYYPNDTIDIDGIPMPMTFPEPVVHRVDYDLDQILPGFFPRLAHAIDCAEPECGSDEHPDAAGEPVLKMARYNPSTYFVGDSREELNVERAREAQISGLLRSGLLKRFESSAHAFAVTCRRMADSHNAFLNLLEHGEVGSGGVLVDWLRTDADDIDDFIGTLNPEDTEKASLYDSEQLKADAIQDRELLLQFATEADKVTPDVDPKLGILIEELAEIAREAHDEALAEEDERDKRKVIIFSYFADTANWVTEYLEQAVATDSRLAPYRDRIVSVSGTAGDKSAVLFGFAPKSTDAPPGGDTDRYDIVISTDVLAEGVNLQQARHVVNYDLPWNPQKLTQRHGRIDRLLSPHDTVYVRCFFPDSQLDSLLQLEDRLKRKITHAARTVGVESEILPGSEVSDHSFAQTRDEIDRLRREDATIFESGGEFGHAYSGEEYRQELRAGLDNPELKRKVQSLPWGSGSGLARAGAAPGFVFCARVGDHPDPVFRYVEMTTEEDPVVVADTLTSLAHAHADAATGRTLDEETYRRAYDAWAIARASIYEDWTRATDPRNLQPKIPKAMRDAALLLRENPPAGHTQDAVDRLIDAVDAPYGNRIQKVIRDALRSSDNPREASAAVAMAILDQGLEPSDPPRPLPVIIEDDVHLVVWQAIVPDE